MSVSLLLLLVSRSSFVLRCFELGLTLFIWVGALMCGGECVCLLRPNRDVLNSFFFAYLLVSPMC